MVQQVVSPDQVPGASGIGDIVLRNALNAANANHNEHYANKVYASWATTSNTSVLGSAALVADNSISCNVQQTGNYAFEGVMYIVTGGAAVGNANGVSGFALAMNANTAVINAISWHSHGSGN